MQEEQSEFRTLMKKSIVALIVGVPLFVVAMMGDTLVTSGDRQIAWFVIGILVGVVMWYSGRHFYQGAWLSFKAHSANMNTLIALATFPAWLYSMIIAVWPTLVPELARHVYFDAPMTVIGLIVLGAALENLASEKATGATREMEKLQPEKAFVKREGTFEFILTKDVKIGDYVQLKAGDHIPLDGDIVEGSGEVGTAGLTGDTKPLSKTVNEAVYAGTLLIKGTIVIKVTAAADESALQKIIKTIRQAQNSKPPIGKVADKIAYYFSPLVIMIALLTPVLWLNFGPTPQIAYMLVTFMAILLIACPCALGLAAPISSTVGVGKAAQSGVLFRNSEAFEKVKNVDVMIIDHVQQDHELAIATLRKRGLKVIEFTSGETLDEKLLLMDSLKTDNHFIAFVCDAHFDESLIEKADLSFALGIQSYTVKKADIAILGTSLFGVIDALVISKATLGNIKQNLIAAFVYNTVGILVAAGIFYPLLHALLSPIIAGAAMAMSSLGVVLNANRLHLLKPPHRSI